MKCLECEDKICEKGWFFCGLGGTPMSMTKSRKQMSEYLDRMLAKREKVVIVAESGKKMAALAAMYASERGYFSYLLQMMICPHTSPNSSKRMCSV